MDNNFLIWGAFLLIVVSLLVIDLGIFNKNDHEISTKESLWMSAFYISIGLLFSIWIWYSMGLQSWSEYLTGFLIEKSLAIDNIFVISLVFSSLSIPNKYQHRVLFWGILAVIVLRGFFIFIGTELVTRFEWVLYLFAIFMIYTGIKMFFTPDQQIDIKNNKTLKWMRNHLPITDELHGNKFTVRKPDPTGKMKRYMTPLLVALIIIEFVDLVFAVDSIPAIFTVTTNTYIVYTSNIFAILGLRALYFCLSSVITRFYYLKYALALVLIFIGAKVFIADLMGIEKFPSTISLAVTVSLLLWGCLYSMYKTRKTEIS
jgi:tellurite resistance protein TerC